MTVTISEIRARLQRQDTREQALTEAQEAAIKLDECLRQDEREGAKAAARRLKAAIDEWAKA